MPGKPWPFRHRGFREVRPQLARHRDGTEVFVADRFHVGYESAGRTALMDAEFGGPTVLLYPSRTRWSDARDDAWLGRDEAEAIVARIVDGLEALGQRAEVVWLGDGRT